MKDCMKNGNSFSFLCHDINELEHSYQVDLPSIVGILCGTKIWTCCSSVSLCQGFFYLVWLWLIFLVTVESYVFFLFYFSVVTERSGKPGSERKRRWDYKRPCSEKIVTNPEKTLFCCVHYFSLWTLSVVLCLSLNGNVSECLSLSTSNGHRHEHEQHWIWERETEEAANRENNSLS